MENHALIMIDHPEIVRLYQQAQAVLNQQIPKRLPHYTIYGIDQLHEVNEKKGIVYMHEDYVSLFSNVLKEEFPLLTFGKNHERERMLYPSLLRDLSENTLSYKQKRDVPVVFFTSPTEYLSYFALPHRNDKLIPFLQRQNKKIQPYYATDKYEDLETLTNSIILLNPSVIEKNAPLYDPFLAEAYASVDKETNLHVALVPKSYANNQHQYDILIRKIIPDQKITYYWRNILSFPQRTKGEILQTLPQEILGRDRLSPIEAKKEAQESYPISYPYDI